MIPTAIKTLFCFQSEKVNDYDYASMKHTASESIKITKPCETQNLRLRLQVNPKWLIFNQKQFTVTGFILFDVYH